MHEVAKLLEFQLQHHSFQRNPRVELLQNGLVGSPCSPRDSQESSPTPQFKSINSSALSLLHFAAERRYPRSEVRGSGLECQAATVQERPRGATLRRRSGAAAERSYLASEVSGGREETPRIRGQGRQLGGATHARGQGLRPGGASRGAVAAQAQEGLEDPR